MAAYPPPPLGVKPRHWERLLRAERKRERQAGAAALRAQRHPLRQKQRDLRRNSVLGPLLLVVFGFGALAVSSRHIAFGTFLGWYGRWWPLLLVAAGAVLLVEWGSDFFLRTDNTRTSPRRAGPLATLLLCASAVVGARASQIYSGHGFLGKQFNLFGNDVNIGFGDFDEFLGARHDSTKNLDSAFAPGTRLHVDNPHGNITVVGNSVDGQIHILAAKQVYSYSDSDAGRKSEQLDPQLSFADGTLAITVPKLPGTSSDLTIKVPNPGELTLTAHLGSVDISSLHASVNVTADHGDVDCKTITGAVSAQINRNGSSFTAQDIVGNVSVRGHAQDLQLTGVDGEVRMEGEFFGNTHLARVHGPVTFRTKRTQLTLGQLPGELDISPDSELTGRDITGPTTLRTSSRNISFEQIAGDLAITDSKGSVDIKSSSPLGGIDVQNRDGAVRLTVPHNSGLSVDAETRGGEIRDNLGLAPGGRHGTASLTGEVGNGSSKVLIRTTHLDIEIHAEEPPPPDAGTVQAGPEARP